MDRAYGGATLVIHVEGTMRPKSPRRPEYIKADVYFPRYLIHEDSRYASILSCMVQDYIVSIGLPVVERWERCAKAQWSMTQDRNAPVPPPYRAQTMPASNPIGSSTFVYHGNSINTNRTPHRDNVDDYDSSADEWTTAELESLTLVEKCATLEDELVNIHTQLTATQTALNESLAREANLRAQLEAAQLGQVRHQMWSRQSSPQTPTTPSRPNSNRTAATTPRVYHTSQTPHVTSPSRSQNGSSSGVQYLNALSDYYSYLREHDLTRFTPSLDRLRKNIPISSWSEQLKLLEVPAEEIDTLMILMSNTC